MLVEARKVTNFHIIMCNHASRVDWLLALTCGHTDFPTRVSFLTEATMQFLPIVGWFRYLCEDVFVWRSFKGDKVRIDTNIASFKTTETPRAMFLAIEGAIVDQGEFDRQYMDNCREFCTSLGYEPFEYLLTPRYKGVHTLAQHAREHLFSATTAFVQDGRMLNSKLSDPRRIVPDLYTVLHKPTKVTVYFDRVEISSEQEEAKRQCMDNYQYRDGLLRHYEAEGCFPGKLDFRPLPKLFGPRIASFCMQMLAFYGVCALAGMPWLPVKITTWLFGTLATSHLLGEFLSGQSRESIPFETLFKSYAYAGRDRKVLAKAKGKDVDPSKKPIAEAVTDTVSEAAKLFMLQTRLPAN